MAEKEKERRKQILTHLGGNPETHYLGKYCGKEGHNWEQTGFSLRHNKSFHCVLCARQRVKNWRKSNPEKKKAQDAIYAQRHAEDLAAKKKQHYLENREMYRAMVQRYETNHREKRRLKAKKYRQTENGKNTVRRGNYVRKLRIKAYRTPYTSDQVQQRLLDFNRSCAYCCSEFSAENSQKVLQWDHFYPLSRGGWDSIDNLVPACASCNSNKKNKHPLDWYKSKEFYSKQQWDFILHLLRTNKINTFWKIDPML